MLLLQNRVALEGAPELVDWALGLAWLFVFGRVAHSAVQVGSANVRWRGMVFMVNFLATFGLWAVLWLLL